MEISTIGLDIAKNVFQVHGVDGEGRAVLRRKVKRDQLLALLGDLEPCLIGMRPARRRIIGRASFRRLATRCG